MFDQDTLYPVLKAVCATPSEKTAMLQNFLAASDAVDSMQVTAERLKAIQEQDSMEVCHALLQPMISNIYTDMDEMQPIDPEDVYPHHDGTINDITMQTIVNLHNGQSVFMHESSADLFDEDYVDIITHDMELEFMYTFLDEDREEDYESVETTDGLQELTDLIGGECTEHLDIETLVDDAQCEGSQYTTAMESDPLKGFATFTYQLFEVKLKGPGQVAEAMTKGM